MGSPARFLSGRDEKVGREKAQEAQKGDRVSGEREVFALCDQVRETAFALHRYLRHGHLERVYENGLANRLRKQGLSVGQQCPLKVQDEDGTVLGDYFADLFIQDSLKACRALANEHTAQLLGYLRACRKEHGLLINFGSPKLEIRKYALSEPT
jgi:GxxExxY protein